MKKITLCCFTGVFVTICSCTNIKENSSMDQEYIDLIKNWKNPQELATMPEMNWESKNDYKIVYASEKMVSFKIVSWRKRLSFLHNLILLSSIKYLETLEKQMDEIEKIMQVRRIKKW